MMTPEQFYFWMMGFTEAQEGTSPDPAKWQLMMNKLATVKTYTAIGGKSPCGGCNEPKT